MVFVVIACCHLLGFITRVFLCSYYNNLIIILVRWSNVHVDAYFNTVLSYMYDYMYIVLLYLWLFPHLMKLFSVWIYGKWINKMKYVYIHMKFQQLKIVTTREERIFITGHRRLYMSLLDPKHNFLLIKSGSVWVGITVLKTTGTQAVLIKDRHLKYPFTIRRLVCGVPLLLHEW
jgi:hypothetical protein